MENPTTTQQPRTQPQHTPAKSTAQLPLPLPQHPLQHPHSNPHLLPYLHQNHAYQQRSHQHPQQAHATQRTKKRKGPTGGRTRGHSPRATTNEEVVDESREEQNHFNKVIEAFAYYPDYSFQKLQRAISNYEQLPPHHKALLPTINLKFNKWKAAVQVNAAFIEEVLNYRIFVESEVVLPPWGQRVVASEFNMEKVTSTIRQVAREWSSEGEEERKSSYGVIIEELCRVLPVDPLNPYKIRVLCPGSGLGRLPYEICKLGYACQGNEYSYFMLIMGNYILNVSGNGTEQHELYPYLHQVSNVIGVEDQFRPVMIPDVSPSSLPDNADFSYSAGDWLEAYGGQQDSWDCVVTCFFLDTANNIIQFVETIKKILKPGGRWINLGPLLYHYADMPQEQSVEISLEELMHVVKEMGFLVDVNRFQETYYTNNPLSMMKVLFNTSFFSAKIVK